jgi:CheY-like chemotaxis protein
MELVANNEVILCVDDEETSLSLRKPVLEKAGYEVVTAASATEALEVLSSRKVDLLLTDYLMPGLTGTELARAAKNICPGLPVILLSGVTELPADMDHVDLFVSKVEGPQCMCEKVAAVLSASRKAGSTSR